MNRRAFLKALAAGGVAAAAPVAVLEVFGMAPRQLGPMHTGGFVDGKRLHSLDEFARMMHPVVSRIAAEQARIAERRIRRLMASMELR